MNLQTSKIPALTVIVLLSLAGCASQPPTIAHTHIGHAMTGWVDTPDKQGLLVTAENAAQEALEAAESAAIQQKDIALVKSEVYRVIQKTKPGEGADGSKKYGVYNALDGAVSHITFAANSADASTNVKESTRAFSKNAKVVLDRCDLIIALGSEILATASVEEANLLADELFKLADANVNGEDIDGDGVKGSIPSEYGLAQLRTQLQAMIDREVPPYRTVETWYLFNLVRQPNGDWVFLNRYSEAGGSRSSYY